MKLTKSTENRLSKFSDNHSKKHMEIMRKEMENNGKTFEMANTIATVKADGRKEG